MADAPRNVWIRLKYCEHSHGVDFEASDHRVPRRQSGGWCGCAECGRLAATPAGRRAGMGGGAPDQELPADVPDPVGEPGGPPAAPVADDQEAAGSDAESSGSDDDHSYATVHYAAFEPPPPGAHAAYLVEMRVDGVVAEKLGEFPERSAARTAARRRLDAESDQNLRSDADLLAVGALVLGPPRGGSVDPEIME